MRIRSSLTAFPIWQLGGAVARVDENGKKDDRYRTDHEDRKKDAHALLQREWPRAFQALARPGPDQCACQRLFGICEKKNVEP